MQWWNGNGHMAWMGVWWFVGAAVIAVVVWAVLRSSRRSTKGSSESPERVLARRYAKGDIDDATYQRMLTQLKG